MSFRRGRKAKRLASALANKVQGGRGGGVKVFRRPRPRQGYESWKDTSFISRSLGERSHYFRATRKPNFNSLATGNITWDDGGGGRGGEWRLGTHSFRSRSPTRFRAFPPRSPLFLCSARLLATPRLVATTPSLFFAPFLYPRLIDAGLENQDGRPITLSISRSPVYLRGNILPKNKYLRRARPLAFRFFIHHPPLHPLGGGWRPFPGSSYPSSSRKDLLPEGESNLFALEMMTILLLLFSLSFSLFFSSPKRRLFRAIRRGPVFRRALSLVLLEEEGGRGEGGRFVYSAQTNRPNASPAERYYKVMERHWKFHFTKFVMGLRKK